LRLNAGVPHDIIFGKPGAPFPVAVGHGAARRLSLFLLRPAAPAPRGRVPVRSSNLVSVGHDPDRQVLEIEFRGGRVYVYYGVPVPVHAGLMGARSHGRYFHARIRGRYRYQRVS